MTKPLEGRLAVITGASRGIGRATALKLASEGAHVVAIARARSQAALESLDDEINALGGNCTLVPMDVRDGDSIDRLGGAIYERWGKIDILVLNAAILGPITPIAHMDIKDWAAILETNVTANYRFIRSMDPILKLSDAGRVIVVSSAAAGKHKPYWGGYAISKAAVEELALTYAAETASSSIKVNVIDPGPIATQMRAKAVPGENPENLPTPEDIAPLFNALAQPTYDKSGEVVKFYDWAGIKT